MTTENRLDDSQPIESHRKFHHQLIASLRRRIAEQPPFSLEPLPEEEDAEFITLLDQLCKNPTTTDNEQSLGQQVVKTIVARYPHITPMIPRDLFWYFGGDCLHYLGDEEIEAFQRLDEDYHKLSIEQPDIADYAKLRASVLGEQPQQLN